MPTRVLIAIGPQVWRDALSVAMSRGSIDVIAETGDGREAVSLAAHHRPDIVVIDSLLPGLNGVDATRMIISENPGTSVIAISRHADAELATRAMRAGASGYVLTEGGLGELTQAFEAVTAGGVYMSPEAEAAVLTSLDRLGKGATNFLSPREREVLQLLAEGNTTKESAETLKVSTKTIETHRRQLMTKLGIFTIAGLTKFAIRHGLTSVDD